MFQPRTLRLTALAAAALALPLTFASPDSAEGAWGHPHGYGHNPVGAIVGGALLGLGIGAAVASAVAPPVYYAPPPVYYAPPPVYYAPAPVYYAPMHAHYEHPHGYYYR